jgi:hypothetical protein
MSIAEFSGPNENPELPPQPEQIGDATHIIPPVFLPRPLWSRQPERPKETAPDRANVHESSEPPLLPQTETGAVFSDTQSSIGELFGDWDGTVAGILAAAEEPAVASTGLARLVVEASTPPEANELPAVTAALHRTVRAVFQRQSDFIDDVPGNQPGSLQSVELEHIAADGTRTYITAYTDASIFVTEESAAGRTHYRYSSDAAGVVRREHIDIEHLQREVPRPGEAPTNDIGASQQAVSEKYREHNELASTLGLNNMPATSRELALIDTLAAKAGPTIVPFSSLVKLALARQAAPPEKRPSEADAVLAGHEFVRRFGLPASAASGPRRAQSRMLQLADATEGQRTLFTRGETLQPDGSITPYIEIQAATLITIDQAAELAALYNKDFTSQTTRPLHYISAIRYDIIDGQLTTTYGTKLVDDSRAELQLVPAGLARADSIEYRYLRNFQYDPYREH